MNVNIRSQSYVALYSVVTVVDMHVRVSLAVPRILQVR